MIYAPTSLNSLYVHLEPLLEYEVRVRGESSVVSRECKFMKV
jgi:hypothetical protein